MLDFALVEIEFEPTSHGTKPQFEFSAYLETPDVLAPFGPTDFLPIDGVAWTESASDQYATLPVLAFPYQDATPIASVANSNRFLSLQIDCTRLPTDELIRIGLWGYVRTYNIIGGPKGVDGPYTGTVTASDFYGVAGANYQLIGAWDAASLNAGAVHFLQITGFPFAPTGHDRLIATFPGLSAVAFDYGADATVTLEWSVSFAPLKVDGVTQHPLSWKANAATIAGVAHVPADNTPDDYIISPVGAAPALTYWDADLTYTRASAFDEVTVTYNGVAATIPAAPAADGDTASISGTRKILYYVPTWHFSDARTATIRALGVSGPSPWTAIAERDTASGDFSLSWEDPLIYPDRLELADLGTGTVAPRGDPVGVEVRAVNHFGHIRIGTIFLMRSTGAITFTPSPAAGRGCWTGNVEVDREYRVPFVVGRAFTSRGQILRPATPQESMTQTGPALGKKRRTTDAMPLLASAQGVSMGVDFLKMRPLAFKSPGGTVDLTLAQTFSGVYKGQVDADSNYDNMWCWEITRPYPCTVVAVEIQHKTNENV